MTIEDLKKAVTKDGAEINVEIGFHHYPVKSAEMSYFNYIDDSHPNHWALVLRIDEDHLRANWPGDVYAQAIMDMNEKTRKWEELDRLHNIMSNLADVGKTLPELEGDAELIRAKVEEIIKAKEEELK